MKNKKVYEEMVSKCCHAKVEVCGIGDFIRDTEGCTMYNICTKCSKDCDIIRRYSNVKPNSNERR